MRLLAALLGAILILVTASPADAAPSGRTVRLARTVGVDITVPAAACLGAGMTGGALTGQLGVVEVVAPGSASRCRPPEPSGSVRGGMADRPGHHR